MTGRADDVTGLLLSWRQGDAAALDRLVPLVYQELRRVAVRHLRREAPGHALQATALVHEVYLRLVDVDRMALKNRAHFFGVSAVLMRQILVDQARRQRADKRGGGVTMLSLDDVSPATRTSRCGRARARPGAGDAVRTRCPAVARRGVALLRRAQRRRDSRRARDIAGHGRARLGLGEGVALSATVATRVGRLGRKGFVSPLKYHAYCASKTICALCRSRIVANSGPERTWATCPSRTDVSR